MKEQTLNPKQSLELISRMIRNTRNRLERQSGRPFLIWGYTTVGVSLFNYIVRITGMHPEWSLTWFLIPVIGICLMRLFPEKKANEPTTELDRIVGAIWKAASLAMIPAFIFGIFHGMGYRADIFAMVTLLMAIGTAATGLVVRSRVYTIAGFTGMALSCVFAIYYYVYSRCVTIEQIGNPDSIGLWTPILIFAAIFVVMMVIPGHIMQYKAKHTK